MFFEKVLKDYRLKKSRKDQIAKFGYYIAKNSRGVIYSDSNDFMNLEIKCPLISDETAKSIIRFFVSKGIKEEGCYESSDLTKTYFKLVTDRPDHYRLRIILTDEDNLAPWEIGCNSRFKEQWSIEDKIDNMIINEETVKEDNYDL